MKSLELFVLFFFGLALFITVFAFIYYYILRTTPINNQSQLINIINPILTTNISLTDQITASTTKQTVPGMNASFNSGSALINYSICVQSSSALNTLIHEIIIDGSTVATFSESLIQLNQPVTISYSYAAGPISSGVSIAWYASNGNSLQTVSNTNRTLSIITWN